MAWPMGSRRLLQIGTLAVLALGPSACSDDASGGFFSAGEYTESGGLPGVGSGSGLGDDSGGSAGSTGAATASMTSGMSGDTTGTPESSSTGVAEDSTGEPPSDSSTSSGSGSSGSSSSGAESSTGPQATCGNDLVEGSEVCDGADLAGSDCVLEGFDAGTLACAGDCSDFDTSACISFSCGNDLVEGTEACDGSDLAGADCVSEGFDAGTLACAGDCTFDTSGCIAFNCGNGIIEGTEVCDGANLSGEDCVSQGFDAGVLACAADCSAYDTSGCSTFSCGNGVIEGGESCDGAALGGATCPSLGHDAGTLQCAAGCTYDESGCIDYAGDCCAAHANPGCDDPTCTAAVCAANSFCCDNQWDALCTSFAFNLCPSICDNCGDGTINGPSEVCDGADVGTDTCQTQGFDAGTLGCAADCTMLDTSGCYDYGGDCCAANGTPGCDDPTCTTDVCNADPTCCTGAWDATCAATAATACPSECNACAEQNIGSAFGPSVAGGTTVGEDEDFLQTCGNGGAVDRVISWTAPSAGSWVFDLIGSNYDTVLSIYSSCDPSDVLGCNDDFAGNPSCGGFACSELQIALNAGDTVLIVVSGYLGATGTFNLNIN